MPRDEAEAKVFVPHWHPHQLRHTKATEIRREAGLDAARAVLGHRSPKVTEVYAEIDVNKAAEVMAKLGQNDNRRGRRGGRPAVRAQPVSAVLPCGRAGRAARRKHGSTFHAYVRLVSRNPPGHQ
jgi:hypothetical protein